MLFVLYINSIFGVFIQKKEEVQKCVRVHIQNGDLHIHSSFPVFPVSFVLLFSLPAGSMNTVRFHVACRGVDGQFPTSWLVSFNKVHTLMLKFRLRVSFMMIHHDSSIAVLLDSLTLHSSSLTIWGFPKSMGYPQSSSIWILHEINHPYSIHFGVPP